MILALEVEGRYFKLYFSSRSFCELWQEISQILCVQRLARKSSIANDDFRSPKVKIFFGDDGNCWVSRKENGIVYHWDITRFTSFFGKSCQRQSFRLILPLYQWWTKKLCKIGNRSMFSAGNITEKMRVAKFDCKNEVFFSFAPFPAWMKHL